MDLLLDTHVFLWWDLGSSELGVSASAAIRDSSNRVLVSAAVGWEIAIKRKLGRPVFDGAVSDAIAANGFSALPISVEDAEWTEAVPPHHQDPFDRIMIAQSQRLGLVLVTADVQIRRYEAPILWARP